MQMDLLNWCVELAEKTPGITFEFAEMNEYDRNDVWWIEILHNHNLREYLHSQVGGDDFEPYNMETILEAA